MNPEQTQQPPKSRGLLKNLLLVILSITTVLFFVFGYIQKIEADRQREMVVKAQLEAENNFKEAEQQRSMALYFQHEAEKQKAVAAEALAACEKSKKK